MTNKRSLFGVFGIAAVLTASCSGPPATPVAQETQASMTVCGAPASGPVQGVDISHYQGAFNWSAARKGGASFGYASIGDGTGYTDPDFAANWASMKAAGVLRGAYQYFEPAQDPGAQANLMVQAVGMLGAGDLPCMLDVETTGNQPGATIAARVRTWLQAVHAGTGRQPLLYTGPSFWDGSVGDASFGAVPLWIADYGPICPSVPNGWSSWTFWQYGDSNGALDQDVFNGTLAQLQGLAGPVCTSPCASVPRVGIAAAPLGQGYWIVDTGGHVSPSGNAGFFGDLQGVTLAQPVAGVAAAPSGQGYWLVAADGGVFAFGAAGFHGSKGGQPLNKPVVGMTAAPDGGGYWLVAADGGVFAFGSAGFFGSTGQLTLNKPMVGMAATPTGQGYWLVGADGGVFAFGDAVFKGSTGSMHLNAPIVALTATLSGQGYWLVGADGGVFAFGDAAFHGSAGGMKLNQPVVAMAATSDDGGYWLAAADGGLFTYGDAPYLGNALAVTCAGGIPQQCVLAASGCYALVPATPCAAGEACSHGTCQQTCTDACTAGAGQCSGADIQVCGHYGSAPCNQWSQPEPCPAGLTCSHGVCGSPSCSDDCEPGATACRGGALLTCTALKSGGCHTWGTPTACQGGQQCQPVGCVTVDLGSSLADGGDAGDGTPMPAAGGGCAVGGRGAVAPWGLLALLIILAERMVRQRPSG